MKRTHEGKFANADANDRYTYTFPWGVVRLLQNIHCRLLVQEGNLERIWITLVAPHLRSGPISRTHGELINIFRRTFPNPTKADKLQPWRAGGNDEFLKVVRTYEHNSNLNSRAQAHTAITNSLVVSAEKKKNKRKTLSQHNDSLKQHSKAAAVNARPCSKSGRQQAEGRKAGAYSQQ
jgi:hypothetical protein